MAPSIIQTSRAFFHEIVLPILERRFAAETREMACGVFGYGSECLGMDDEVSRDHHWGLRVDVLMPDAMFRDRAAHMLAVVGGELPRTYGGHNLREGHVAGAGLAPESLEAFLTRTIGIPHAPRTLVQWLDLPEVDIVHVTNGEVWHDPSGRFTGIRNALSYYPEPVWLRRISHWCRYFSGMGVYALQRALIRGNHIYAMTAFSRAIKWAMEIAFLLNRTYFPYDKWLDAFFRRLPTLADRMAPLIDEGVSQGTSWERRLEILEALSDILDERMVSMGIIPPHPRFRRHPTSGYRLLEHAYGVIVQKLPEEVKHHVPCWDQVHMEEFHTGYVGSLDLATWDGLLHLEPVDP